MGIQYFEKYTFDTELLPFELDGDWFRTFLSERKTCGYGTVRNFLAILLWVLWPKSACSNE